VHAKRHGVGIIAEASVGGIPHVEKPISLATGDQLTLTRELTPGRPAACDQAAHVLIPPTIGCTSAQVFEDAQAGERVWMDDGRIGGVIERQEPDRLHIRVTHAGRNSSPTKGSTCPTANCVSPP
jgi:pyruvate kinase